MNCPKCNNGITTVTHTENWDNWDAIIRTRRCPKCGHKIKTRESIYTGNTYSPQIEIPEREQEQCAAQTAAIR